MIVASFLSRLCCTCGVPIPPNPANMCVACLRTQVDISEGIPKQVTVHFCKQCERFVRTKEIEYYFALWYLRKTIGFMLKISLFLDILRFNHLFFFLPLYRYLQPPATWVQCALESRELLSLCLKKIKSSMTKVNGILTLLDLRFFNRPRNYSQCLFTFFDLVCSSVKAFSHSLRKKVFYICDAAVQYT